MASAPFLGGGFGHFYAYAPAKIEYAIDRYAMEVKRQLDVLDRRLAESAYLAGADYSIADIAVWPWYGALAKGLLYGAGEFLQVQEYRHVQRWTEQLALRPGAKRGRMVNRTFGQPMSFRCTSATTPPTRHPHPGQAVITPLRLRHRAEPAPRPHPAAEKGLAHETVQAICATTSSWARLSHDQSAVSVPCCTDDGLLLSDNAAIAATSRPAIPSRRCSAARRRRRRRSRAGTGGSSSRARLAIAEAMRNSAPSLANRALPGPVNYAQIPELQQRGLARLQLFLLALNERLAEREYIAGNRFSIADITAVVGIDFARVVKVKPGEQHPHLLRWRAAMAERPAMSL
jgi:glutathione S-transferase